MEETVKDDLTGRGCPYPQCLGILEFKKEKGMYECSCCTVKVRSREDIKEKLWEYSRAVSYESERILASC